MFRKVLRMFREVSRKFREVSRSKVSRKFRKVLRMFREVSRMFRRCFERGLGKNCTSAQELHKVKKVPEVSKINGQVEKSRICLIFVHILTD